ncbi:hypothetical protein BGZ70_003992 [Mortierella alpina]|uniref:Mitochondrial carrier protein n=1 Tax=Mortierella alpina TaxID=64518 RepID=A0A9P6IRG2_MORAP|nr:hypothetical protein BGZ70_003992 [Mortierella alpina]
MPSDASTNLRTSAAAAFCARILVHPLDNIRVSIQYARGIPAGSIPQLGQLLNAVRQQLQLQQKKPEQNPYLRHSSPKFFYKERMAIWRGVYKGASFAVMFQVPALAAFLSTYDATKHGLAYMANAANVPSFQLHDTETHLVSGMMAKAAGTLVWAPMNRIQSVATHSATGLSPLTFKDAYRVARQICRSEGASGLWTGYSKSLSTLLPYTMIYFATYEQLKQMARANLPAVGVEGSQAELDLTTYMMCVATAVTTSSALCETAAALNSTVWGRLASMRSIQQATAQKPTLLLTVLESLRAQPSMHLSPLPSLSSWSPVPLPSQARYPSSFTMASTGIANFNQLATLTTTSRLQFRSNLNYQCVSNPPVKGLVHPGSVPAWHHYTLSAQQTSVSSSSVQTKGVIRTIIRGLGPRVLWTVPGVTLTTAGFETLRNMASIST